MRVVLLVAVFLFAGCNQASPRPSGNTIATNPGSVSPSRDDPIATLVAALRGAGATVAELDTFSTDPLPGRGFRLCVSGQPVHVYVLDSVEQATTVARTIDPTDPSHVGTAIVEWIGNPTFWQAGNAIVLYSGSDPAVKAGLTSVLGRPFAAGHGSAGFGPVEKC